jgi:peptidoglycan hydrolase-like protein with peptidoglycan-binding domain
MIMKRLLSFVLVVALLLSAAVMAQMESIPLDQGDAEAPETMTPEARTLKRGDTGDEVEQLQSRLKELLYYKGPISGKYLEMTEKAVKAVQTAYGLEATGQADSETLNIIYGQAYRPLKKGDSGADVKRLQERLIELGYYWGKVSGNYLDGTTAAIGNFQIDNGIERTGNADVATQQRIYSDDILVPTLSPGATPAPTSTASPEPDLKYPGRLSYGSKGKAVGQVQQRLKDLGFFDRKITNGFYTHTQAAVKKFQTYNGLVSDGAVGEATWNALYSADVVDVKGTPRPSPAPTPVPWFVEVDVNNQLVKVFSRDEKNEFTNLEKVFWCSTGTTSFPSEVGVHVLTGRKARSALFPTWGNATARWWVRITPEIAFHSILFSSSGAVSMKSVNRLGNRASHGCIRLSMADAKWMYDNIGKGVEVWIHEDAPTDPELKFAHKPGDFDKKTYYHKATPAPSQAPAYSAAQVPESNLKELKVGAQGEEVYWIQQRLAQLGFYTGTITGQYREGTQAAVKAYQKANSLKQTGRADKATLTHLYDTARAEFATQSPLPTDTPTQMPPPTATSAPETATPESSLPEPTGGPVG